MENFYYFLGGQHAHDKDFEGKGLIFVLHCVYNSAGLASGGWD